MESGERSEIPSKRTWSLETQESTGARNRTEGCVYPTPWYVIWAKWYTEKRLEETPKERGKEYLLQKVMRRTGTEQDCSTEACRTLDTAVTGHCSVDKHSL